MKKIVYVLIFSLVFGLLAKSEVNTVKAADIDRDLLAHWKFDQDIKESVHDYGTKNGAKPVSYIDGVYGKAAYFNGKDNYLIVDAAEALNLGNSEAENNDNFTISFWVNLYDLVAKEQYILDKGNESSWSEDHLYTNPYRICIDSSNVVEVRLSNEYENSLTEYCTTGNTIMCDKTTEGHEWKLITITYDGATIKRYDDNQLVEQKKYSDGITFNNESLYIGVNGNSYDNFFKGALDDLRIYTRTLTYDDIDALYQEGVKANKELIEPTKQLVAYYPFDSNLKDSSSFENEAEKVAVGGTTKYVIGMNGQAITMSKGNYIRIPNADQLNFDYEYTMSFWMKSTHSNEQNAPILYQLNPANGDENENQYTYRIEFNDWSDHESADYFMQVEGFDTTSWCQTSNAILSVNLGENDEKYKSSNWNHITYTYKYDREGEKGLFNVYVNGVLKNKTDQFNAPNVMNACGDLYVGYDNDSFFTGAIDELKIYNKYLNATEVKEEYNRVDSISLTKTNYNKIDAIKVGKTITCPAITLFDVDKNDTKSLKPSDKDVKLYSSNKKVFTVDDKGIIKGVKAGKANLTIVYGGLSVSYKITVKK